MAQTNYQLDPNMDQGIKVEPTPIIAGQRVDIEYDGLLAKAGAQEIYLHAGFGRNDSWTNVMDIKMTRQGNRFVTRLAIEDETRFNFCFRDNAGNWDNNNGRNWSFEIHNGKLY
ncbi:carbohydrate-binding protein [Anoxybacter fermentans]|uniref:Carbohydrate-binding protein n=1 Tax=Anoxybacter fermentans TaxID=1323375 RepID=A0A3Q9HNW3_9FIRM|nr:carbohydrate-binding protein [Anoxybacter fermentans]AZR72245.1 carbohydrate-binding protein [Anoxybacter fermentans]